MKFLRVISENNSNSTLYNDNSMFLQKFVIEFFCSSKISALVKYIRDVNIL